MNSGLNTEYLGKIVDRKELEIEFLGSKNMAMYNVAALNAKYADDMNYLHDLQRNGEEVYITKIKKLWREVLEILKRENKHLLY